ncbi:hypothetical protein BDV06DRAFT_219125 [Aspergillus oleicola]
MNAESEPEQEPLSPNDFTIYNRLAEKMSHIHAEFRNTWTTLKTACSQPSHSSTPQSRNPDQDADCIMDDTSLILLTLSFISSLSNHHSIEENYIFPTLATRMPEFSPSGVLMGQHGVIHDGLVRIRSYLRGCERFMDGELDEEGRGEKLNREKLRGMLMGEDGEFERVLWEHLDREVEFLEAERMRKCWRVEEVRRLPM